MIIREGRGFRIEGRVQRTSQTDEMILEMIERASNTPLSRQDEDRIFYASRVGKHDPMLIGNEEAICDFRESSSEDSIIRVPPEAEETRTDFS